MVPGLRTGVVVLANSNTVPTWAIATAALDIASGDALGEGWTELRTMLPPVVGPVAETLARSGPDAAAAVFHRLSAATPAEFDVDDGEFEGDHLDWIRTRLSLLLICGQGQWEDTTGSLESTKRLAGLLAEKGIRHELDLWGYDVPHDWPSWRAQIAHHLPRFC